MVMGTKPRHAMTNYLGHAHMYESHGRVERSWQMWRNAAKATVSHGRGLYYAEGAIFAADWQCGLYSNPPKCWTKENEKKCRPAGTPPPPTENRAKKKKTARKKLLLPPLRAKACSATLLACKFGVPGYRPCGGHDAEAEQW
nr:unnamed protein product [Digitaria exilis]